MDEPPKKKKNPFGCYDRRYLIELVPTVLAIGVALIVGRFPRTQTLRLWVAGLGCGALLWFVVVTVAAIRRLDELQQRIHLIAIAISFTATGCLTAMSMFFDVAGVSWRPSGAEMWMFMFFVWAIGAVVLEHRYR